MGAKCCNCTWYLLCLKIPSNSYGTVIRDGTPQESDGKNNDIDMPINRAVSKT